jgi:hypothetical protein
VIGGGRPLRAAPQLLPDIASDVDILYVHDQPWVRRPPGHAERIILVAADYGYQALGDFILVPEFVNVPGIFLGGGERDYSPLVGAEQAGWAQVAAEGDRTVSGG